MLTMNSMLKDLFGEFIEELSTPPLEVKNIIHQIHIHVPYDEQSELEKDAMERIRGESSWIEMVLPVTPQIGEEIEFPLIKQTGRNYRGYIHSVKHSIDGVTQVVYLDVHPFNNYYYKWAKMKDEYEYRERWIASLKNRRM